MVKILTVKRFEKRIQLAKDTKAPFGAGAFVQGNILLIGEQSSNPDTAPNQLPFCDDRGCSGWLNAQLDVFNIPEEQMFWVNALNNDDSEIMLSEVINQLQPRRVIALGRIAEALCVKNAVDHVYVPHPQYWKRFQHNRAYALIGVLRECLHE